MCWLVPGLLENVTGVIAALLSGWFFHVFPEMQWKEFVMKDWKPPLDPSLMGGRWVGNHRNPPHTPNIGPICLI